MKNKNSFYRSGVSLTLNVGQATPDRKRVPTLAIPRKPLSGICRFVTATADPRQKHSGERQKLGFTLIELLVVVLIIGILAAVAVPQYQQAVMKGRIATVLSFLQAVKNAEETYYLANGEYTTDMESLAVEGNLPQGWTLFLQDGTSARTEARYQYTSGAVQLAIVANFNHRTDVAQWAGITYCYAAKTQPKYDKLCKSMGTLIPGGDTELGTRYYIR